MQGKLTKQRGEKTCEKQLFAGYVPSLHIFERKYPHVDFFGGRTSCWHGKSKEERDEKDEHPIFSSENMEESDQRDASRPFL